VKNVRNEFLDQHPLLPELVTYNSVDQIRQQISSVHERLMNADYEKIARRN